MKTFQYRSNIQCNSCVKAVSAFLNEAPGIAYWAVDIAHPDKILTVESEKLSSHDIEALVQEAGFELKAL